MVEKHIWSQVVTLHARVESELGRVLQRKHGVGLSEYRALCHLTTAPDGELRIQELADLVGLTQSSLSRLVDRLERDGLTERGSCPKDRRGVYSMITEAGRTRWAEAAPTYNATLRAALEQAEADPRVARIAALLSAADAEPAPV